MADDKQSQLDKVREAITKNDVCPQLRETATNLVMGDGNLNAEIVFIGEAPGKNEDEQGLPFVGAAVRWALAHAKDPQPAWPNPSCAWFGSNVLMKGGLPKTNEWTDAWLPRPPRAATYTPALVSYLQRAGLAKVISLRSRFAAGKNAVPEARPGDLIVYDWDDDGTYDHTSVVVRISPGSYPDVAEWGTAEGPGTRSKYVMRGWTWREKAPKPGWLRRTYPDVTAILVHITK